MDEGDGSRAARRRWPRIVAWSAAALLALVTAAVVARVPLAETALRIGLSVAGFPNAKVDIAAIGWRTVHIAAFSLGPELALQDVTVTVDPDHLHTRPVSAVTLGRLTLDLTVPDGPLRKLLFAVQPHEPAGKPPGLAALLGRRGVLPEIAVDSYRLRLPGKDGVISLDGAFLSRRVAGGGLTARLSAEGAAAAAGRPVDMTAQAFIDLSGDGATLTFKAASPEADSTADVRLGLTGVGATPRLTADGTVRVAHLSRLAGFVPALDGIAGALHATVRTTGPLALPADALRDPAALLAALRREGEIAITAEAERLKLPRSMALPGELSARAVLDVGRDAAKATLSAKLPDAGASGDLAISVADPRGEPKIGFDARLRLGRLAGLATAVPALSGMTGWAKARVRTAAPVAVPLDALADRGRLKALLRKGGALAAQVSAELERHKVRIGFGATADLKLDSDRAELALAARSPDTGAAGEMKVTADDPYGTPMVSASAQLRLADLSRLGRLIPVLRRAGGAIRITARTGMPVPLAAGTLRNGSALSTLLQRAQGIPVTVAAHNLRYRKLATGLSGSMAATLREAGDTFSAAGHVTLSARRLEAGTARAHGVQVAAPLVLSRSGDTISVALTGPVTLSAASFSAAAVAGGPVALTVNGRAGAAALSMNGKTVRFALDAEAAPSRLAIVRADGTKVPVELSALRLRAASGAKGTMRLNLAADHAILRYQQVSARLDGIAATFSRPKRHDAARFKASATLNLAHDGQGLFAPLSVTVDGALVGTTAGFSAHASGPAGFALDATGEHDISAAAGAADVGMSTIQFGAPGVRIADLIPGYRGIEPASGTLGATGRLSWGGGKVNGSADLRLDSVDIEDPASGMSVQGLSTRVRFDRLIPLRSPPGQELRVRRILAGVPLDDLLVRFAIRPGSTPTRPVVAIDRMGLKFAGGTVGARDVVFDPGRAENRAIVRVAHLDLATLLSLAKVEGLSGTGNIGGTIPVRMVGSRNAIDGGLLESDGPGVLKFESAAAKKVLAAGGQYADLLFKALADFRYDKMSLEINKTLGGEGRVMLRTLGRNPAVENGRPFAINLNVTGNVDRLAAVIGRVIRLPDEILRSIVPKAR